MYTAGPFFNFIQEFVALAHESKTSENDKLYLRKFFTANPAEGVCYLLVATVWPLKALL